jgi:hypothetical protein
VHVNGQFRSAVPFSHVEINDRRVWVRAMLGFQFETCHYFNYTVAILCLRRLASSDRAAMLRHSETVEARHAGLAPWTVESFSLRPAPTRRCVLRVRVRVRERERQAGPAGAGS